MRIAITGATGFIGRNFTNQVIKKGHSVTLIGPLSMAKRKKIQNFLDKVDIIDVPLEDLEQLKSNLKNFDLVTHFAATSSTKNGFERTDIDLKKGVFLTYNILEAMRLNHVKKIVFPSAPAVYGYPIKVPTSEETGMLMPVSLYGAAKLACEGLISAFCHLFDMKSWIFRLGNVVGSDMDKGAIRDFIIKLKDNPDHLQIYGDGSQTKDVIYIDDCIDGILFAFKKSNDPVNVFNLSSGTTITVNRISEIVQEEMNLKRVKISHLSNENVGWRGDVPVINYNINKIKNLGWKSKFNSEEAVRMAVKGMIDKIAKK